ncbi:MULTISPECIES: FMN-binding negative transcriptional regulator [Methylomonas]|uniref:Transcriptional regulator n=2 Tax=Methylomonas TaxID=416 RepID=A0A140E5W3_9GAMM|nr:MULTISPECIES: FMN-binding negative transcriptional regulator [Methylomonas]AMK78787.1 transcriptional regulator [Methylomonas denitrificans]OAI08391.1 transcriptional regulator [Methylomonas methanica]TCV83459.1 PaiB family negative transcriptional regulator [Methylomonas methanica]
MYIPKHFEEPSIDVLQTLIRDYPLATLIALSADGINANHIPLHLTDDGSPYGTLRGHIARSNPLWTDFDPQTEVLAVFQTENAYISPSWYESKQQTGKVVPTWNYAAVHAYGSLRTIDDSVWIRRQLEAMTQAFEAGFPEPWFVSDAPADFTERLITQIIGIEISVSRLQGKWKVSQNQPPENQNSVIKALRESGQPAMANLVADAAKP